MVILKLIWFRLRRFGVLYRFRFVYESEPQTTNSRTTNFNHQSAYILLSKRIKPVCKFLSIYWHEARQQQSLILNTQVYYVLNLYCILCDVVYFFVVAVLFYFFIFFLCSQISNKRSFFRSFSFILLHSNFVTNNHLREWNKKLHNNTNGLFI